MDDHERIATLQDQVIELAKLVGSQATLIAQQRRDLTELSVAVDVLREVTRMRLETNAADLG